MKDSRNNILKRLRQVKSAVKDPYIPNKEPIYSLSEEEDLVIQFAQSFTDNGGKFVYGDTFADLAQQLSVLLHQKKWESVACANKQLGNLLRHYDLKYSDDPSKFSDATVGITSCEALIARTGSVFLSSASEAGRSLSILPDIHIVIATTNQVVSDLKDILSLQSLRADDLPSMLNIASNNSQTADIEKTLVNGAHGPIALYVFMTEAT